MKEIDYVAIGARIREARKKVDWTQEELAERAGISLSFMGHVERGTRKASVETIVHLSEVLSADLHYWLTGESISDGSKEIIRQYLTESIEKLK